MDPISIAELVKRITSSFIYTQAVSESKTFFTKKVKDTVAAEKEQREILSLMNEYLGKEKELNERVDLDEEFDFQGLLDYFGSDFMGSIKRYLTADGDERKIILNDIELKAKKAAKCEGKKNATERASRITNQLFDIIYKYCREKTSPDDLLVAGELEDSLKSEIRRVAEQIDGINKSVQDIKRNLTNENSELDKLIHHLLDSLVNTRANHPSFRLLRNDGIDNSLLPDAPMPAQGKTKRSGTVPVWSIIKAEHNSGFRHIIIEGDGGIGKSVSLLSVTDDVELLQRIPAVYIHMYDLTDGERCRSIADYLKEKHSGYADAISRLAGTGGRPKLMLLLDGLNEVSLNLQYTLLDEIRGWANQHPGAQIIMTSRQIPGHPLVHMLDDNALVIHLKKLDWSKVTEYLSTKNVSIPKERSKLGKTIVLPLFLTLYAKTADITGKTVRGYALSVREPKGPASLVWNYLQRELLRQKTDKKIVDCAFACELIVPYIAFSMAQNHDLTISSEEAKSLIGSFGTLCEGNLPKHLSMLLTTYQDDIEPYRREAKKLQNLILKGLGLFVEAEEKPSYERHAVDRYSFLHQVFRDSLAAMHLVNAAEMVSDGQLPEEWKNSIRPEILEYTAELMDKTTSMKLWEANRKYKQYTKEKPKDNVSTYMLLELHRLLKTKGDRLNFSGMDIRGMSLTSYMGQGNDLKLFREPELARDVLIDRKVFESVGPGLVSCLTSFPDGRVVSGSYDGIIRIWNMDTGECIRVLPGHTSRVNCLAVLPDGRIVSGALDGIRIWSADLDECMQISGHTSWITCLAVLADGRIVSGAADNVIYVWDANTGECLQELKEHTNWVKCIVVLPGGHICSGSADKTIRIWDADTGKCLQKLKKHTKWVDCLSVLPDGSIVSGSDDNTIRIWDAATGSLLQTIRHPGCVSYLVVLRDGRIVSGSKENGTYIWNADAKGLLSLGKMAGPADAINCCTVLRDGRIVSGSSHYKTICVWDAETGERLRTIERETIWARNLAVFSDGRIVSGLDDKTLRILDVDTGECLQVLVGHTSSINALAVFPDKRKRVVSGSADKNICIWDAKTGNLLQTIRHPGWVNCLAVLPDGCIVSGSDDGMIRIWDSRTGKCLRVLPGHTSRVNCLAVLPDGHIVSGSMDMTICIWDVKTGNLLQTIRHPGSVNCFAVLPDGRIVSGSADGSVLIWNANDSKCKPMNEKHFDMVTCIAVLPDGRIVSGSKDQIIRIWDANTGICIRLLRGHTDRVTCLTVLPNGHIVSGAGDSSIRVWNADTNECPKIYEIADVNVSRMYLSNANMDNDTIKLLYQNMAKDHSVFEQKYRNLHRKRPYDSE